MARMLATIYNIDVQQRRGRKVTFALSCRVACGCLEVLKRLGEVAAKRIRTFAIRRMTNGAYKRSVMTHNYKFKSAASGEIRWDDPFGTSA